MSFDVTAFVAAAFIGLGVGMAYIAGEGRAQRHPMATRALQWGGLLVALVAAHGVH